MDNAIKFTKREIEKLNPPADGRLEYRDTDISGLRLRITSTGTKSFSVVKHKDGAYVRVTLGRFPEMTVDMARASAMKELGLFVSTGVNPNEIRRIANNAAITLGEVLQEYLKSRTDKLKPQTVKQYSSLINNYSGDWVDRKVAVITREMVDLRHRDITFGNVWFGQDRSSLKSGVGKGSEAQANLWGRVLRAALNFAHDHYRDSDDSTLLPEPPTKVLSSKRQWNHVPRKNELIRAHDLGRWLNAVNEVREQAIKLSQHNIVAVCDALDVALFTGLRRAEVFGLTWDRINFSGKYFWIDETKNGEPLELPITNTLMNIFKRRKDLQQGSIYVFPSMKKDRPINDPRDTIEKIVKATVPDPNPEYLEPIQFKCHDARRTFATIATLANVNTYLIKRLMNHKTGKSADVTQGYIHYVAEDLRTPSATIENAILRHAGRNVSVQPIENPLLSVIDSMLKDMDKSDKALFISGLLQRAQE